MVSTKLVDDIRAALQTEECGEALVEVARNACDAEMRLARILRKLEEMDIDPEQLLSKED